MNVWASLLSVIDSNLNVDLLGGENETMALWVELFECDALFHNIHTKHPRTGIDVRPPAEATGFVQFCGSFPFSFMIFYILFQILYLIPLLIFITYLGVHERKGT